MNRKRFRDYQGTCRRLPRSPSFAYFSFSLRTLERCHEFAFICLVFLFLVWPSHNLLGSHGQAWWYNIKAWIHILKPEQDWKQIFSRFLHMAEYAKFSGGWSVWEEMLVPEKVRENQWVWHATFIGLFEEWLGMDHASSGSCWPILTDHYKNMSLETYSSSKTIVYIPNSPTLKPRQTRKQPQIQMPQQSQLICKQSPSKLKQART